jgi:hypothetical protein
MTKDLWVTSCGYLLVGILWGCTNPFIKHAQQKILESTLKSDNLKKEESNITTLENLIRLVTNYKLFIPYAINQSGSLAYYYMLSNQPVNQANPICNSLTFVFTAITGYFVFNETFQYPILLLLGIVLVVSGIYVCITSD